MLQPVGTNGSPTTPFGWRIHPITHARQFHTGVDIGSIAGVPILAAADGVVTTAASSSSAGNYVVIHHGQFGNVDTRYLHQSRMNVRVGQTVKRGDVIGWVGSTGSSTKPHLHFEVKVNGTAVDPQGWIGPLGSLRA